MHLRAKCVPCLLSPTTHLLLVTQSLLLSPLFSASLHESFSHLIFSPLSPFVLDNFSLSFDRCQCDSMNSTVRFTCNSTRIYATCLRVLYAPARTTGRCVERIGTHTDQRVQCLQSGRHYEWQNITRRRSIHVDAAELPSSKNNARLNY